MANPDIPVPDTPSNPNFVWSGILAHLNDLDPSIPQPRLNIPEEVGLPGYATQIQQAYLAIRTSLLETVLGQGDTQRQDGLWSGRRGEVEVA